MKTIEQRARELLAEALRRSYPDDIALRLVVNQLLADELDLINARVAVAVLVAALTPPEGFVLVPARATQEMYAAWMCSAGGWADRYKALLAARPGAANE
jgi:hypothetical protein